MSRLQPPILLADRTTSVVRHMGSTFRHKHADTTALRIFLWSAVALVIVVLAIALVRFATRRQRAASSTARARCSRAMPRARSRRRQPSLAATTGRGQPFRQPGARVPRSGLLRSLTARCRADRRGRPPARMRQRLFGPIQKAAAPSPDSSDAVAIGREASRHDAVAALVSDSNAGLLPHHPAHLGLAPEFQSRHPADIGLSHAPEIVGDRPCRLLSPR